MPRKLIIFVSIIILVSLSVLIQQLAFPLLPIRHVTCQLNSQNCPDSLQQTTQTVIGSSLFFSKLEERIDTQETELYQLESLSKELPGTVHFQFSSKQSSYLLQTGNDTPILTVAENGIATNQPVSQFLPEYRLEGWDNNGNNLVDEHGRVEQSLHQLISQLNQALISNRVSFFSVELIKPEQIIINLNNDRRAIIQKENLEMQIRKLAIIQRELDVDEIDPAITEIDLRFELPVLRPTDSTR